MDVEQPVEEVATTASTPENLTQTRKSDNGSNQETKKQEDAAGSDAPIQKEESKQEAMDVVSTDTPAKETTATAAENDETLLDGNSPRETVVYGSINMFLFLRLHRFIYERISIAKKLCSISHNTPLNRIKHPYESENETAINKKDGDIAKAGAVETKKNNGDEDNNFTQFLSSLYAVVDNTCDNSRFEDHCRNLMGTGSYHLHNIDKLIAMTVKAMITFATHDASQRLRAFYDCEIKRKEPTTASYTENCAALIRTEVTTGRIPKLEMFRFFMMKGVAATTTEEAVKANNKDGTDVKDLLNLEALGIAPQKKSNQVRLDCPKAKVDSFEPQHGWRVVPRLSMRYVPIKKTSDTERTPVHEPGSTNGGKQVTPNGTVAEAEKHEAGKVTDTT